MKATIADCIDLIFIFITYTYCKSAATHHSIISLSIKNKAFFNIEI